MSQGLDGVIASYSAPRVMLHFDCMISHLELTPYSESAQTERREVMDSDRNSLTLYLREIGKVKRLSPEEEIHWPGASRTETNRRGRR